MFLQSIRFKITILYMAILAITLTSFSLILYHNVSYGLYSNMDTLLKSKAGGIAQAIDAYWEASNIVSLESGVKPDEVLKKRRNVNFTKVAQKWVKEESTDPKLLDIIVQVFDTDGAIIASSKNTRGLADISRINFITVLQGRQRFDTTAGDDQMGGIGLRVFTAPVFEHEKVAYIVQVSSPLDSIEAALNNLKIALFLLLPVTVLATGLVGAFLAKVTLRPVDSMIHTIHQITAENMKLKLHIPETKDEIQKLAQTFNDMLGRLESAFTSQRRLFEDLSHELKTPLTILKGEFEVILKKTRSPGEYESILKSALEEVNRITKLAENLLLFARFDSGQIFPEKKRLDLNLLVGSAVNGIKKLAELKNIKISLTSRQDVSLIADEGQLKTLFINILDNAVKYTPPGGNIYVTIDSAGRGANVEIEDTGAGIPEKEIGHIFDRFYRAGGSRNSFGFGLGLSIAKSIAEAHGGKIEAASHPPKGSIFTVTLPVPNSQ